MHDTPHSKVSREKISRSQRGQFWITDGKLNRRIKPGSEVPLGWQLGRTLTVEQRHKAQISGRENGKKTGESKRLSYEPKSCIICGALIEYERRKSITCSPECLIKHRSNIFDPFKESSTKRTQVRYDGILYDSAAEVLFKRTMDESNIHCVKNYKLFPYIDQDGKERKYRPDFYLRDHELYVEIKGRLYYNKNVALKLAAFPENIVIIFSNNFEFELPAFLRNLNK